MAKERNFFTFKPEKTLCKVKFEKALCKDFQSWSRSKTITFRRLNMKTKVVEKDLMNLFYFMKIL